MDIANVKPSPEMIVEIKHPATDEPLGIKVTVCSLDDDKLKRVKREIQDEAIKLQRKGKSFKSDEIDTNHHKICFAAMSGWVWENDATFHGQKPDFNQANVYKVFDELPWFRDQIDEAIGETKSFFQR